MDSYFNIANEGRLDKFGEFPLIDFLASTYNYTHEQVFLLSWSEALTMIAYNREKAYVNHKAQDIYREANKK